MINALDLKFELRSSAFRTSAIRTRSIALGLSAVNWQGVFSASENLLSYSKALPLSEVEHSEVVFLSM